MKNLKINFKNCYGIESLSHEFIFTDNKKTQIIYAKNGSMKSSFTKTFDDISRKQNPEELVYERKTTWKVKVDGNDIIPESICAIKSEPSYDPPDKMSTLLVNDTLKKQYEKEIKIIEEEKSGLITFLKGKTGIRKNDDLVTEFTKTFAKSENDFLSLLEELENKINDSKLGFGSVEYLVIFDDKVKAFLETKNFKDNLSDYISIYESLIAKSKYFKKGIFNYNNAEDICKSLKDNKFFDAEHAVILKGEQSQITSYENLEQAIETDRNKIFSDTELKKKFDAIDKAITKNKQLNAFRSYIDNNPAIIIKLQNIDSFKKEVWISYLQDSKDLYKKFLNVYVSAKKNIETIIKKAKEQETDWKNVVQIFNNRFEVPFILEVKNQEDVILKSEISPQIEFIYKDIKGNKKKIEKSILVERVLSTGEKRALYILNILFEVEARKKLGTEQLLIVDDIADSFDYENKYAIIEYLQEISETSNHIFMIILTHNFDFYRTLQSRFFGNGFRDQSYMVLRNHNGDLELTKAGYFNPFDYFRGCYYKNPKVFIATIPFVRNLIEYSKGSEGKDYYDLTCVLHHKKQTDTLLVKNIKEIFDHTLGINNPLSANEFDESKNIIKFILDISDSILSNDTDCSIQLENKIVLSIAIRILAEKIMIAQIEINNPNYSSELGDIHNQTMVIYKKYKAEFVSEAEKLELLKQVMLMTPENIHLNSFMYEPLVDLGEKHIRDLYSNLKKFV